MGIMREGEEREARDGILVAREMEAIGIEREREIVGEREEGSEREEEKKRKREGERRNFHLVPLLATEKFPSRERREESAGELERGERRRRKRKRGKRKRE